MYSDRSCDPRGEPNSCVVTAHDAATGEIVWYSHGTAKIPMNTGVSAFRL